MEIDYIKAHMVVERYVQGKLDAEEEAAFEERLVWDQALQEDVDLAETLRSWMLASHEESSYSIPQREETSRWRATAAGGGGVVTAVLSQPHLAAAASFILGVFITFSALQNVDNEIGFAIDESAPSFVVPLIVTRSSNPDLPDVPVTSGAVTLLMVDVLDTGQRYNVEVRGRESGELVWTQFDLAAGYLEAVAVGIPGGAMPPGEYTLSIESASAEFQQEISFETVYAE